MANIAAGWRPGDGKDDSDHPLHQSDLKRGNRTVHCGVGAEIGGGYMVAAVGGLFGCRGCHQKGRSAAENGAAVDAPGLRRLSGAF